MPQGRVMPFGPAARRAVQRGRGSVTRVRGVPFVGDYRPGTPRPTSGRESWIAAPSSLLCRRLQISC